MAYSMFERPKLHNAKSMKFYPENYDHHVSFRHKNLPPDFDLTVKHSKENKKTSIQAQMSSSFKKCPIYVHTFSKIQQDGDFEMKRQTKSKHKQKSAIDKLEETYWANWKPSKNSRNHDVFKNVKPPEIHVIKSAPERRRKIKLYPTPRDTIESDNNVIQKISSKSEEIQTDPAPPPTPKSQENEKESNEEIPTETKFLKHTDSFILNVKKHKVEKEHFEQPKCIRLYRKPGKMSSKNFIKGGSYPLKPCLKKESTYNKGNIRLGRPGSPVIITTNHSKHGKTHRH